MKIAAIMAGRITGYEECVGSHNYYIFNGHSVDVFLAHNAKNDYENLKAFAAAYPMKRGKSFHIDISEYEKYPLNIANGVPTYNSIYMFRCIHEAFQLIPNPDDYDIILYMRADMQVTTPLPFEMPAENTLYIPDCNDHGGGLNDQIAYGRPDVMRRYCSLFSTLHTVLSKPGMMIHPESLVRDHVAGMNITLVRFPFEYKLSGVRWNRPVFRALAGTIHATCRYGNNLYFQ